MDDDQEVGPGQWKGIGLFDAAHSSAGGLSMGAYYQIVVAASEAATLAVMRAMQQTETVGPTPSRSSPPDEPRANDPSSNGNESETGLEPFERTYTAFKFLQTISSCSFAGAPAKKRVPRANQDKLVDVRGSASRYAYR